MKICLILATFNRVNLTNRILLQIQSFFPQHVPYSIIVVDGGSTDGTQELIKNNFNNVDLIIKDGAYWNQAMRLGIQAALKKDYTHLLLLNDDVKVFTEGFNSIIKLAATLKKSSVLVGCCVDPISRKTTYGALKRNSKFSKLNFSLLSEGENTGQTFNANCLLISKNVFLRVGNLSKVFAHSQGDIDFGLRCTKAGVPIIQMNEPFGELAYNKEWAIRNSRLRLKNWRLILLHPKGIRVNEWLYFCLKHGGPLGFLNFIWRYIKILFPTRENVRIHLYF